MARPAARTLAAVAAGALAVGGAAAPAAASWSGSWSGPGASRATTLPAVGTVDAVCAGGASVAVSWAAAAPATAYEVWRSADLGPWTLVRAADPARTYTDTAAGLVNVSVRWHVVASRNAWCAPASAASPSRVISTLGICL
jgi:hypothetical protein